MIPPFAVALDPVLRRLPLLLLGSCPTFRKPQRTATISSILDKSAKLAVGNKARTQRERFKKNAVARQFIIEREPGAVVPDRLYAALVRNEALWLGHYIRRSGIRRTIRRT